mmetsp:Transcript_9994/g.21349  ORF Transcript_9994/g.21349 Transcript_9994/m.21349 type:complete len:252 (-) Transcript_9994:457-1212(-)
MCHSISAVEFIEGIWVSHCWGSPGNLVPRKMLWWCGCMLHAQPHTHAQEVVVGGTHTGRTGSHTPHHLSPQQLSRPPVTACHLPSCRHLHPAVLALHHAERLRLLTLLQYDHPPLRVQHITLLVVRAVPAIRGRVGRQQQVKHGAGGQRGELMLVATSIRVQHQRLCVRGCQRAVHHQLGCPGHPLRPLRLPGAGHPVISLDVQGAPQQPRQHIHPRVVVQGYPRPCRQLEYAHCHQVVLVDVQEGDGGDT